jgi:hypothetical protein
MNMSTIITVPSMFCYSHMPFSVILVGLPDELNNVGTEIFMYVVLGDWLSDYWLLTMDPAPWS